MRNRNDIEMLFRTHYPRMLRLAAALLHDAELARDTVHDVFASLLDMPSTAGVAEQYLMTAVRNRCLNLIRHMETHRRIAALHFLDPDEYDAEEWPDEETLSQIRDIMATHLTPRAREVLELRFASGAPFAEIALRMGISETAVFRHLKNALTIIRQKLKANG